MESKTYYSIRFLPRPKTVVGSMDVTVIKPDETWLIQRKELYFNLYPGIHLVNPRTVLTDILYI